MGSCTTYCSNCTDDTKEVKTAEVKGNSTTPYKKDIYDANDDNMMGDGQFIQYQGAHGYKRGMNQMLAGGQ